MKTVFRITSLLILAAPGFLPAEPVRVEITRRAELPGTGYEEIAGRMHFEIDPAHPRNRIIADVGLAPKNPAGNVSFSSDLRMLKPLDPAKANGAAWVEIPNRGGSCGLSKFMSQRGFTIVQVGWEFDVPAQPGKLRIAVPAARQADGNVLRGVVRSTFTPEKRTPQVTLTDLADYPPVDPAGPDSRLLVRHSAPFPDGTELPRERWQLAGQKLTLEGGFEPGKTYEISYLSANPPVAGLGLAAIRDAVAWLKHDASSLAPVRQVYAFGSSQCGRLLREFVYLGFNTDEQERQVFDGIFAHVAGAGRLVINQRWAVPRAIAAYATASYPFADAALTDPISGVTDGIQQNPRVAHLPKTFYLNTASEYWGAGRVAALTHTNPEGTRDVPLPENVRSYFVAGTQHGPASFPPAAPAKDAPLPNPVNPAPIALALRLALHEWVTAAKLPPPSTYPKLSDGTLVPASAVRFPPVPRIPALASIRAGVRLPNPLWPDGAGAGTGLPLLVPQVDADGNDLGGIRLPDIEAPLATCTGWVFRTASTGAPEELVPLRGAWWPFAATASQRRELGDPRPSLAERYGSLESYLQEVSKTIDKLIAQGLVLAADRETILKQADAQWTWLARGKAEPANAAARVP